MRILVFGGTRFMGRHLVTELLRQGHDVTVMTRGRSVDPFGDAVHRILADRSDEKTVQRALTHTTFDLVYDSLAYSSADVKRFLPYIEGVRYIQISSASVYDLVPETKESMFDPYSYPVRSCERGFVTYEEGKRQAESAVCQRYPGIKPVFVRFPYVIGEDDYTERMRFYVDRIQRHQPIAQKNPEAQGSFIYSDEAGRFLAFLASKEFEGPINAASEGLLSVAFITDHIAKRLGTDPIFSDSGDPSPYSFTENYCLDTTLARSLGYVFAPLRPRICRYLDHLIELSKQG